MKQRADGAVVAGHAGPGVWVNGTMILPPSAGNDPTWLGDLVLCNDEFSHLVTVDVYGNDRHALAKDANDKILGASRFATDLLNPQSPHWAAFLQDNVHGLFTSWGLSVPTGELYGMQDGTVFGRQNFQSEGGLCAWAVGDADPTHVLWSEPSAVVLEFYALDREQVLWTDNARQIHVRGGLSQPTQAHHCFQPSIVRRENGDLYLMEWRDPVGLVLRPWLDADHGWILYSGEAYGASAQVGDDTVSVVFSPNIAESGEIHRASVNFMTPMEPLVVAPPEPEPPDPQPEPPEPQPEPPDPGPGPDPIPEPEPPLPNPGPSKERLVQISLDSVQEFTQPQAVTEMPHPEFQGQVALKTAAGKFKSMNPQGGWDDDKEAPGAWEAFISQGGIYLAYRGDTGKTFSFSVITSSEVPAPATKSEVHGSPVMGGTQGPHEPKKAGKK